MPVHGQGASAHPGQWPGTDDRWESRRRTGLGGKGRPTAGPRRRKTHRQCTTVTVNVKFDSNVKIFLTQAT